MIRIYSMSGFVVINDYTNNASKVLMSLEDYSYTKDLIGVTTVVYGDKLLYEFENEEAFKEKFPEIFV